MPSIFSFLVRRIRENFVTGTSLTRSFYAQRDRKSVEEGKSSVGRLGIDIHATAGKGDVGFCNTWTLEISVTMPVRVYAGMPVGQLIYFGVDGDVLRRYDKKKSAKYNHRTERPVESMMWKNVF